MGGADGLFHQLLAKLLVLEIFKKRGKLLDDDGREVTTTPLAADNWEGIEPIYETMPGWSETTFGVKERSGLPQAALNYIQRIEELTGVPVDIISTGPDRTETMILRDPFDA